MGQREHLQQAAVEHLVDDMPVGHGTEGVEDGLGPGRHLLALGARQVAQFLPAHRVQGTEDDHLLVLLALQHRLQAGTEGQGRLAGAGAPTE
ncbi:hypothetical protein SDC9_191939 [bioreactor metagenome]|uniref:Uncharacterized protein n=1 Tax=bioreactor metagenome TaxID=1076179 RepID=A0A645I7J9_9ZZZZ